MEIRSGLRDCWIRLRFVEKICANSSRFSQPHRMSNEDQVAMNEATSAVPDPDLLSQYGCGPIRFSGHSDALYERHLLFDDVVDPLAAGARERFEAVARSVRDVLAQRWVRTERTYNRLNPKHIYYLSMEFLIERSLTNNLTNLLLDPYVSHAAQQRDLDWFGLIEQEPDAGLGNDGLGRLAACFLDSMATMELPAMGYGLRYEYGIFRQTIEDGWQHEQPDNWLRRPDPWEVARLKEAVEIKLLSSLNMGTSNMKFMLNGALTLGTRDGVTIQMVEEAREDNFFPFGLTADQVEGSPGWYNAQWHYEHDPETRTTLDLISADYFSRYEPGVFAPLRDVLLTGGAIIISSRGPQILSRGGSPADGVVRRRTCMGTQSDFERGRVRQILERPHDRNMPPRSRMPSPVRFHRRDRR
jgi:hypothetical protein